MYYKQIQLSHIHQERRYVLPTPQSTHTHLGASQHTIQALAWKPPNFRTGDVTQKPYFVFFICRSDFLHSWGSVVDVPVKTLQF